MNTTLQRWLLAAALACAARADAAVQAVGAVTDYRVVTNAPGHPGVRCALATGGVLEVVPYAHDVVRVRFHWTGLWDKDELAIARPLQDWPAAAVSVSDQGYAVVLETESLRVEIVKGPNAQVHFASRGGFDLLRDDRMEFDPAYDPLQDPTYRDLRWTGALPRGFKLRNTKVMPADEAYFGLGEEAGPLNRRGRSIQGWNADTYAWQEDDSPLYMTLPFFYGVRGPAAGRPATAYGVFFNNPARPVFRMGSQSADRYSFEAADGQVDYFFFGGGAGHAMREVLSRYTDLTGHPAMLPKWAFGHHQSRWTYASQDWVQWVVDGFQQHAMPLDAVYLDIDYLDRNADDVYTDNTLRQLTINTNYPDPAAMIRYCHDRGVRIVPIVEPWLCTADPLWGEAAAAGHFTTHSDGSTLVTPIWFGDVSWIDFSRSAARGWWQGKLQGFLGAYPFDGIWNDLNEPADNDQAPLDSLVSLDGAFGGAASDSRRWYLNHHNTYAVRETSLSYAALEAQAPGKRPFVLSRSGWPGIQRYALSWSGDNTASFDHLRHNIRLGLSVMMSGQVNFGHDVGGFIGTPDGELLTRWYEWAVLTPFLRNHSQKWDGEREPWRFGEPYTTHIRNSLLLRSMLMPYLYSLARESTVSGVPMNTPTVMHFPDDTATHSRNEADFMVGDHLLAAPVTVRSATARSVYLPAGSDWFDWWTDSQHAGGSTVDVRAPLGTLPLFARAGAIVPMGPPMRRVDEFQPGYLDLHVWPAGRSRFDLYEDDGLTVAYRDGAYALTRLTSDLNGGSWTFTVARREGAWVPGARTFIVIAHAMRPVARVARDGAELPARASLAGLHAEREGWFYDPAARRLYVKTPDTGSGCAVKATFVEAQPVQWVGNTFHWPVNGALAAGEDVWINTESWPKGAGGAGVVVYSADRTNWAATALTCSGEAGNNDAWYANLGRFSAGSTVEYAVAVIDYAGRYRWDSRGGQNYRAVVKAAPSVQWIGNTYHWPPQGRITPADPLWINTETWPRGAGTRAAVVYSVDGGAWAYREMNAAGAAGNNDWWNLNLGPFAAGSTVRYAVTVYDANGRQLWDSRGGQNYQASVNP